MTQPIVRYMRYDEMRNHVREHFTQLLTAFKEKTADEGPCDEAGLDTLRASLALAESGADEFSASPLQTTPTRSYAISARLARFLLCLTVNNENFCFLR